MKIPIIDISDVRLIQQMEKIKEETSELQKEIIHMNIDKKNDEYRIKAMEEVLDGITVNFNMLFKIAKNSNEIVREFQKHYEKLAERDREIIGNIDININYLK